MTKRSLLSERPSYYETVQSDTRSLMVMKDCNVEPSLTAIWL